ncbi:hypothetical protein MMC26_004283 [Xylographa opegraphella]|nr:hypothetical protein [Xylographa opegraphella]
MASEFTIPSISPDDLLTFHARTYGKIFPGSIPDLSIGSASGVLSEDDASYEDTLGYYPDGVKRTLTDAQITMFRHSELEAVRRAQRHAREKESSDFRTVARSQELQDGVWGLQAVDEERDEEGENIPETHAKDKGYKDVDGEGGDEIEEDDEEEYARFLEAERREMELVSASRVAKVKNQKSQNGKASTRRIVRELDEIRSGRDALDYGD